MDRLKSMSSSVASRIPGREPKPSYAGYSNSRTPTPGERDRSSTEDSGLGSKLTGLVHRVKGGGGQGGGGQEERVAPPVSALQDPKTFAPPPKHRAAYGDEVARASIHAVSPHSTGTSSPPSIPARRATVIEGGRAPPPIPPRLPPRGGAAGCVGLPQPANVTHEDLEERGGISSGAASALGRLGRAGVSIPGFESKSSTTSTTRTPPPPPLGNRSSIGSFSNRFSTSSNPSAPATGTTFAEKQNALKTANAFYKDPTKVSFSDARAAASTAHNFQQRHGEQVAEGARVGNAVGNKFGLISTNVTSPLIPPAETRYQPPPPPRPVVTETRDLPPPPPPRPSSTALLAKKPPPPLPPKKKPPPPVPLATRPPVIPRGTHPSANHPSLYATSLPNCGLPATTVSEFPCDIDLSLDTPWFTASPLRPPQSIDSNPNKAFRCSTSWTRTPSGRVRHTMIISILWTENMSSSKIRLTWEASAPTSTVKAEQLHFPPPEGLSAQLLGQMTLRGPEIVQFCEERMGTQVGNGECWTLAFDALSNTPGMMPSQQTVHGACIFSHFPPQAPQETQGVEIHPGDILQFSRAHWDLGGGSWKAAGDPDHTAVVAAAQRERGGWRIRVLEQNVGGVKTVQYGEYYIGDGSGMSRGSVRVFRPIEERPGWGCPDPEWEE
jgi:hypothetical protein